ncbi:putative lipoprotein [Marinobacter pelagius]|uniref:Putative lipoprotein n=2 Tax=Marinobacter pelagius TaxID=379482 RepID=A0A366GYI5_9GAMM|nr:putative lipoprotein [Marinobacter pelagius]
MILILPWKRSSGSGAVSRPLPWVSGILRQSNFPGAPMPFRLFAIFSLVFTLLLAGCGQKGPLYRDQGGTTASEAVRAVTDGQAEEDREQSDN